MLRYELTIYDAPTPQGRKRAAMTNHGKTFYPEKKDVKAAGRIRDTWLKRYGDLRTDGLPPEPLITGPVVLTVHFYKKAPAMSAWKRKAYWGKPLVDTRPDIDNYLRQIFDALSGYAWIDDKQIALLIAGKFFALYPDGTDEPPHYEIVIEKIEVPVKRPPHPWRKKLDAKERRAT